MKAMNNLAILLENSANEYNATATGRNSETASAALSVTSLNSSKPSSPILTTSAVCKGGYRNKLMEAAMWYYEASVCGYPQASINLGKHCSSSIWRLMIT